MTSATSRLPAPPHPVYPSWLNDNIDDPGTQTLIDFLLLSATTETVDVAPRFAFSRDLDLSVETAATVTKRENVGFFSIPLYNKLLSRRVTLRSTCTPFYDELAYSFGCLYMPQQYV